MSFRRFVLAPACEVAGDMLHPVAQMTIAQLLRHLDTKSNVIALIGEAAIVRKTLDAFDDRCSGDTRPSAGLEFAYEHREHLTDDELQKFSAATDRYAILTVDGIGDWRHVQAKIKLLVCWVGSDASVESNWWRKAVEQFAGPRLELDGGDADSAAIELQAALAAMLPRSIVEGRFTEFSGPTP
jgi:hypothetical protein